MKISIKAIILPLFFALTVSFFYGQNVVSSPYSSFGIGNIGMKENPVHAGMGGVGYALQRNNFVNLHNPAAVSGLDSMSFVFDLGLFAQWNTLSSTQARSRSFNGNLGYLAVAFPVTKWWRSGISLVPLADVSYKIKEQGNTAVFPYAHYNLYEGSGGLNSVTWLNAFRPFNHLSLGIDLEYLFGNYFQSSTMHITDTGNFFNSGIENNVRIDAFNFRLGVQYFADLTNNHRLGFGGIYEAGMSLPTRQTRYNYTFTESGDVITLRDSVSRIEINNKHIKLPMILGMGISVEQINHWFIGADATYSTWSSFKFQNNPIPEMKDNFQIRLGGEIKPNAYGNYLSKITYRFGLFYDTGYLKLRNRSIQEYGITAGIGLPIRRSQSLINIFFRYGIKGTHDNNLLQEKTFNIGISVSSKDRWFFTRKYQ